jgi:hypothetical protein
MQNADGMRKVEAIRDQVHHSLSQNVGLPVIRFGTTEETSSVWNRKRKVKVRASDDMR